MSWAQLSSALAARPAHFHFEGFIISESGRRVLYCMMIQLTLSFQVIPSIFRTMQSCVHLIFDHGFSGMFQMHSRVGIIHSAFRILSMQVGTFRLRSRYWPVVFQTCTVALLLFYSAENGRVAQTMKIQSGISGIGCNTTLSPWFRMLADVLF